MIRVFFDQRAIVPLLVLSLCLYVSTAYGAGVQKSSTDITYTDGNKIPNITALELSKKISASEGKVIIVDFWATWCPPCKEEIPGFISLYEKYRGKGVEIIGVALDFEGSKTVKPFAARMGINYPLFIGDRDINRQYNIDGIPTTLVFNKDGVLKARHVGFASEKKFESEILKYLD